MLPIYDITKFSLLDYPNKISSLIWFSGCNYRCCYCYNTELINKQKNLKNQEVLDFLKSRKHLLQAVVLTGGECTLYDIYDFVKEIKSYGYLIKIYTNGSNHKIIKKLIDDKLIDYIALDFKSSIKCFYNITKSNDYQEFEKTLNLLILNQNKINVELRTTLFPNQIEYDEVIEICNELKKYNYNKNYYIQNYRPQNGTLYQNRELKEKLINLCKESNYKFNIELRNF